MEAPSNNSFLPMTIDAAMDGFRVEGHLGVRALVRELKQARALVTLYAGDDPEIFVITAIRSHEADEIEFDLAGGESQRQALSRAPYLTAVGLAGSVKIQFRLEDASFAEPVHAGSTSGSILSAGMPAVGWRVQRRNTFRVRPPVGDKARVGVRLPEEREAACCLEDLSVGGLAFLGESLDHRPMLGAVLRHCRLEATGIAPIPCELRVVQVEGVENAESGGRHQALLVRCEFVGMPHSVSRLVQMYVMDIERRARLESAQG